MVEQIAVSAVIAVFVVVLVIAILRQTVPSYGGARTWSEFRNYAAPDGITNWIPPALVLVAVAQVGLPELQDTSYATWLIISVVVGVVAVAMARPGLRTLRDIFLSLCAMVLVVLLLAQYISRNDASALPAATMVGIFAVCFLFGVLLNILRTFNIPRVGLSALGAIEILLFLMEPFSIDLLGEAPIELYLILLVVAVVLGVGAAAAPDFLIALGGIAICAAEVGVNVYLWLNAQGGPSTANWTGALLILGTQVGVGLGIFLRGLSRVF